MFVNNKTNVLLPQWLLDQQATLSEQNFLALVRKYFTRYPDYELVRVENGFVVCVYPVRKKTKRRKKV